MTTVAIIGTFPPGLRPNVLIPYVASRVSAGFPSPADDHLENVLDLNELCIAQPAATFFVRASGCSMSGGITDIHDGDLLVVNRAMNPAHGQIVIACVEGEFCVKRLKIHNGVSWLAADNPDFPSLYVEQGSEVTVWGVVDWILRKAT